MWKKRTGLLNIMYLRPQRFFVIEYLTIVLLIVFGSSVESTGSGFSVSDNKIPPRLQPEGVSNVLAHGLYPEDSDAGKDWQNDYPDSLKNSTPSIAKCCREGEGFNSDGECMKLDPSYKHNLTWHPSEMFVVANDSWAPFNTIEWEVTSPYKVTCPPNHTADVVLDLGKFVLNSDGGLFLSHHRRHLESHQFCFEQQLGNAGGRAVLMACFTQAELVDRSKTLRKCCPNISIVQMTDDKLVCISPRAIKTIAGNWTVVQGSPVCEIGERILEIPANDTIKIGDDGALITKIVKAPFEDYCLDHFQEQENEENPSIKILLCLAEKDLEDKTTFWMRPTVTGAARIVSCVCLALAGLISLRLPELRSLHGKCQLSHLATLFSLFVLLATVQLGFYSIPHGLCTFFAVAIHICALSSFLWLNVLCVCIYLTFRSMTFRPSPASRRGETHRYFFLCLYAWGIPVAFCLLLWTLDKPGTLDPMPAPGYGHVRCLMSTIEAELAYLFGPVGFLLLLNGIFFCLTAKELLWGVWRQENSDSINLRRKSMGIVVAKLAIVMGLGWVFDIISWAIGPTYTYLFFAADLFNSLQGLFILIVIIWRKRVLEVLHLRKSCLQKI